MKLSDTELLEIFEREFRRECTWTRMKREAFPNLVRHTDSGPGSGGGFISWSSLTSQTAGAEIERQVEHFKGLNTELEWVVYSFDQPAELGEQLIAHGFVSDNDPGAVMVIDIEDLPGEMWSMDISKVKRVTTPEEVDAIFAMENEVWGEDLSRIDEGLKHDLAHASDLVSVFAVWDGEIVVSAAWSFYLVPTSFASLYGGSTRKPYRRRGYYTALLAARAREARERGFRFLHVDAGAESQPILAKIGFRCLGYNISYDWKP